MCDIMHVMSAFLLLYYGSVIELATLYSVLLTIAPPTRSPLRDIFNEAILDLAT